MSLPPDFPLPRRAAHGLRSSKGFRWAIAIFVPTAWLGLAVALVIIGLHQRSLNQPIAGWVQTTGRIVDVAVHEDRATSYAPIIEFTDQTGHTVRSQAPYSTDEPAIGTAATVSYDSRNPHHAHDLSETGTNWEYAFIAGVGFAGLMVVATPIVLWVRHFYRKAFQPEPRRGDIARRR